MKRWHAGSFQPAARSASQSCSGDSTRYQVIGVARHARLYRLDSDDRGQIYAVHAAAPEPGMSVAIRSGRDLEALGAEAKAAVKEIDPLVDRLGFPRPGGSKGEIEALDTVRAGR